MRASTRYLEHRASSVAQPGSATIIRPARLMYRRVCVAPKLSNARMHAQDEPLSPSPANRLFAMTAWKGASFEKRELAAAPRIGCTTCRKTRSPTSMRFSRGQSPAAGGSAIDLAAALREHHAVGPTTGSEPCQMLRAKLSPSRPKLTIALIRHVGVRRRWRRTSRASGTSI